MPCVSLFLVTLLPPRLLSAGTFSLCLVPQQLLLSREPNTHVRFVALTQCSSPLTVQSPSTPSFSVGAVPRDSDTRNDSNYKDFLFSNSKF